MVDQLVVLVPIALITSILIVQIFLTSVRVYHEEKLLRSTKQNVEAIQPPEKLVYTILNNPTTDKTLFSGAFMGVESIYSPLTDPNGFFTFPVKTMLTGDWDNSKIDLLSLPLAFVATTNLTSSLTVNVTLSLKIISTAFLTDPDIELQLVYINDRTSKVSSPINFGKVYGEIGMTKSVSASPITFTGGEIEKGDKLIPYFDPPNIYVEIISGSLSVV